MSSVYPSVSQAGPGAVEPPSNVVDVVVGVTLYTIALVLAACSFYVSFFFLAFSGGACSGDTDCGFVGDALAVTWGSAALGVVVGAVMLPIAAWRHWPIWIWGVIPNILVIGGFALGYALLAQQGG